MNATLPNKEMAELQRRFKKGFSVEQVRRGGHFRVLDPQGEPVRVDGAPVMLPGSPSTRNMKSYEAELRKAGVLREPTQRGKHLQTDTAQKARLDALRETTSKRAKIRQAEAKTLHDRMAKVLNVVGGLERPGNVADVAYIGAMIAREMGESDITPDLLMPSISRVRDSNWIGDGRYVEIWNELARRLEEAETISTEYFRLLRLARNIPDVETLVSSQLELPSEEWPFKVELIEMEKFFLDHTYQRPPDWPFIRGIAASFDETLVGALDVSDRGGRYAIMDGQLRYEAMRLVGKKTAWASIYSGLDKAGEAGFFLRKNKNRKSVNPYYTFRARILSGDPDAVLIEKIVRKHGYLLSTTSGQGHSERNIASIYGLESAYKAKSETRSECLTPTLETMRAATFGRRNGNASQLLTGFGRFFATHDEVEMERLASVVAERGPDWIIGKAREESPGGGKTMVAVARILTTEYNRTIPRGDIVKRLRMP